MTCDRQLIGTRWGATHFLALCDTFRAVSRHPAGEIKQFDWFKKYMNCV